MSTTSATLPRQIPVFFYGSFIRPDIMSKSGVKPSHVEVARLSGFDISISPHACITRSDQHSIYGILISATHEELHRMYSKDGVGVFLPEAVIVETRIGCLQPAMCYIPPVCDSRPADIDYLDRLLAAARGHSFPAWYLERLERFRPVDTPT